MGALSVKRKASLMTQRAKKMTSLKLNSLKSMDKFLRLRQIKLKVTTQLQKIQINQRNLKERNQRKRGETAAEGRHVTY